MDHFDPALISVVMPCHNAAPHVREAIASVLRQTHPHFELIVVDDGSTDGTETLIAELAVEHADRISIVHQTHSGPYPARNAGLAHAHGNFVAFLDADDTWHPEALAQLYAALTEHAADVAYCGWQYVGEAAADTRPHIPPDYTRADATEHFLEACPWPIHGVLLRRHLIDALRGFSERRATAMDYDLWLRMLAARPKMVRVPQVLAFQRCRSRIDARIPRWRQVLDAVAVREHFARRHGDLVAHLGHVRRDALIYGPLLAEAYRCHWRRDTDSSRRLFRRALRKADWKARDAKYLLASLLPAPTFDRLIHFVDARRARRNAF